MTARSMLATIDSQRLSLVHGGEDKKKQGWLDWLNEKGGQILGSVSGSLLGELVGGPVGSKVGSAIGAEYGKERGAVGVEIDSLSLTPFGAPFRAAYEAHKLVEKLTPKPKPQL